MFYGASRWQWYLEADFRVSVRKGSHNHAMCWSQEVSFTFACLDLVFVATLLYRGRLTYAVFLGAISLQEWAQWAVWKTGSLEQENHDERSCTPRDIALSFTASGAAQSIPVILALSAWCSRSNLKHAPTEDTRNRLIQQSLLWWLVQFLIIVACVWYSGIYCVQLGRNHHQVWICASSVYETGGYPLYLLTLVQYLASAILALKALPIDNIERQWIYGIGLANGVVAYGVYCWTLEACSIWCWSAFGYGIYFCFMGN